MAYIMAMGSCVACKRIVTFNPETVPSVRVSFDSNNVPHPDENGTREPLCLGCAVELRTNILAKGGDAPEIPHDAYDALEVPDGFHA